MAHLLRNWEIVLYALHLQGGATRQVHTEDIALKCFRLAPDAFSWVKHAEYPDKEVVRRDLIRLRAGQFGDMFAKGRSGKAKSTGGAQTVDGWQLTQAGVRWVLENENRLRDALNVRSVRADRQETLRSLERVRKSALFQEFLADATAFSPQLGALAELVRCRVDSENPVWEKRFARLRNLAQLARQDDVLAFVEKCEELRPILAE